jgi:hypothetical protein
VQEAEKKENPVLSATLAALSASDWEMLISALLPTEILKPLGEETIDATFDFLNENSPKASISFRDLKAHLTDSKSTDAVMAFVRTQPACSAEDLLKLTALAEGGNLVICQPPEISMPVLQTAIEKQLQFIANLLPDEKTFLQEKDKDEDFVKMQKARLLMRLSPLLPMLLLLLVTLAIVRSLSAWLRWWGIPLLIAGVIAAASAFLARPILQSILSLSPLHNSSLSPAFMQLINDIIAKISHSLIKNIAANALWIALLGLLMTLGQKLIKKKRPRPESGLNG